MFSGIQELIARSRKVIIYDKLLKKFKMVITHVENIVIFLNSKRKGINIYGLNIWSITLFTQFFQYTFSNIILLLVTMAVAQLFATNIIGSLIFFLLSVMGGIGSKV